MDNHQDLRGTIDSLINSDEATQRINQIIKNNMAREQIRQSDLLRTSAAVNIALSPNDLLAQPQPLPNNKDAVLLTRVIVESETSAHLAVKAYQVPGKTELDFVLICFVPDHQNTLKTKFSNLEPVLLQEVTRQLRATCTSAGDALFGMIIVPNYFSDEHDHEHEHQPELDSIANEPYFPPEPPASAPLSQPSQQDVSEHYPPLPPSISGSEIL